MTLNEFKDRLFDLLNESDDIPIADIIADDGKNEFKILLKDHTSFTIICSYSGSWFLME